MVVALLKQKLFTFFFFFLESKAFDLPYSKWYMGHGYNVFDDSCFHK